MMKKQKQKKNTKTIAIVVVCPLSMLLLLLYYYCWYCFACGSFLDKSLRFFLVQFSFATKTALCLFCLLSKYAKTFCILVAASRFGCCCCCFVSFGCTFWISYGACNIVIIIIWHTHFIFVDWMAKEDKAAERAIVFVSKSLCLSMCVCVCGCCWCSPQERDVKNRIRKRGRRNTHTHSVESEWQGQKGSQDKQGPQNVNEAKNVRKINLQRTGCEGEMRRAKKHVAHWMNNIHTHTHTYVYKLYTFYFSSYYVWAMMLLPTDSGQADKRGRQNRQAQEKSRPSRLSDSVTERDGIYIYF